MDWVGFAPFRSARWLADSLASSLAHSVAGALAG